uniref:Uncharacterized protein n=1 Tax=Candidatus Kentrum sp. MB TaxID=2138164 RepID=A0A450XEU1_9GAMM|nr:MAG: hypothetical protein BECKMB1821G_GA0114241_103020 [Candidatus Kentron sp. MB]VFK30217.1 MAG: hypothetical protein BECKMB1821I_GA0114274_101422 [Candidatus Kentron sp. MB]VFK75140.1 MAG: hypothetical protein BECKMB1821H_GA0114242_101622 [Candidatus Kentron sp. MB]
MSAQEKLAAGIRECRLHADVLQEARTELGEFRFTINSVDEMTTDKRRLLDQMAYRFSKLQDSMGMKILPGLLELTEEPFPENATFAEKLQRLERLGAIADVNQWRMLRELRNQLSHEYENAPSLKAAVLNRFLDGVHELLKIWETAVTYYDGYSGQQNGAPTER